MYLCCQYISELAISYPSYTPMLIRAQELWFHEPAVTTPVLKLFAELAQNRLNVAVWQSYRITCMIKLRIRQTTFGKAVTAHT